MDVFIFKQFYTKQQKLNNIYLGYLSRKIELRTDKILVIRTQRSCNVGAI